MADMHSPLAQLADIGEPSLHSALDLPPVAWIALVILLLTIVYAAWRLLRRWRYFAAKREAIKLLSQLKNNADCASEINQLLKRVLQHYQPAHAALSLPVVKWQQWLKSANTPPLPDLDRLLYSAKPDQQAVQQFYGFATHWLEHYNGKAPPADALNADNKGGQYA